MQKGYNTTVPLFGDDNDDDNDDDDDDNFVPPPTDDSNIEYKDDKFLKDYCICSNNKKTRSKQPWSDYPFHNKI